MPRTYQAKYLGDGTLNPKYVSYYQRKQLDDGTLNPKFRPDKRTGNRHLTNENRHSSRAKWRIIAIDGEGINTGNIVGHSKSKQDKVVPVYEHLYVLLVASSDDKPIISENGLSTVDCFDFLLDLAKKYPDAIFVCFGASYDVNKILKDLPFEIVNKLYENKDSGFSASPIYWKGTNGRVYAITYRPRRSLTISRVQTPNSYALRIKKRRNGTSYKKYEPQLEASMTLWDVSGFFPGRFVDALGDKDIGYFHEYLRYEDGHEIIEWPDGLRVDLTLMKNMKNRRRSFTYDQLEEIAPYCHDEVKALQRLMERLRELLTETNLLPYQSRYYGAGACANTLLHRYKIKESMNEYIIDPKLKDVQLCAYSGGRFELGKFGLYIGKVWNYDIRSAFPAVMPELPCLTGGMWRHIRGMSSRPYSIVHVRWRLSNSTFYPFYFRNDEGSIYYPDGSEADEGLEGWYWKPEVDVALKALHEGKLAGSIEILESWEFHPYYDTKPFEFIRDVYEQRLKWQLEGNPAHKVLKFTINYIYGKFAQSLGWTLDQDGGIKEPSYHNIGYAGFITSSVRAQIFDAIMQSPENIVNIVSDGIYSLVPLDLPTGEEMGRWKVHELDGIIMVNPGVFWGLTKLDHEPTEHERNEEYFDSKYFYHDGDWYKANPHYQGFDRGQLTPDKVLRSWNSKSSLTIKALSTRFVTMASALLDEELWKCWGSWKEIERELQLYPHGKRVAANLSIRDMYPAKYLEDTVANRMYIMSSTTSAKFKRAWDENNDSFGLIDGIDKDIYLAEHLESEL